MHFYPFTVIALLMLVIFAGMLTRRRLKRMINRTASTESSDRCVCGYLLNQLDRARCPECGRVRNFDATAEQLGLSSDQLESIERIHRQRKIDV